MQLPGAINAARGNDSPVAYRDCDLTSVAEYSPQEYTMATTGYGV